MSEAANKAMLRLRELAAEYAAGSLHQSAYRVRRARILDELVGLAPLVQDQEITRPRGAPAEPAAQPAPVAPAAPVRTPAAPRESIENAAVPRSGRGLVIGVVIVLGAGAALGWWLWRSKHAPGAAPEASPAAAGVPGSSDAFIADFLSHDDWSDAAISRFNSTWWSLSDAQVAPLLSASSTMQLRGAVAAHLRAQADRSSAGSAPLDPSAPLILLARNLDVPVPEGAVVAFTRPAATAPTSAASALSKDKKSEPAPAPQATAAPNVVKTAAAAAPTKSAPGANPTKGSAVAVAPGPASGATAVAAGAGAAAAPGTVDHGADACAAFFIHPRQRLCHDMLASGAAAPNLVIIGAGSFSMGSNANPDEAPVHTVTIPRPFAVTVNEISLRDYRAFCSQAGRSCPMQPWSGDLKPVVNVSWNEAVEYAKWLSQQTGQRYRLASEAEWEFMARAGSSGDYWSGAPLTPGQARFVSDGASAPATPADESEPFQANAWSVKHVAGNVREWVADVWTSGYAGAPSDASARTGSSALHVVRGGSYHDPLPKLRSSARDKLDGGSGDAYTGIRLVRELTP